MPEKVGEYQNAGLKARHFDSKAGQPHLTEREAALSKTHPKLPVAGHPSAQRAGKFA